LGSKASGKKNDVEAQEQVVIGLKPQVVEVNVKGRIDGAYKGKTTWDDTIRSITPHVFDVSIVHVKDQNLADMVDLYQQINE
jgi:hypothetical protein